MKCPMCANFRTANIYKQDMAHFTDGVTSMPLSIALCENCGFVFQESAYSDEYDSKVALAYQNYRMSENFAFPRRDGKTLDSLRFICDEIVIKRSSNVLEIGSDRGDFLYLLHEQSGANVVGIEPLTFQVPKITTVKGYFNRESFCSKFDLIILKHTLEHIKNPKAFLDEVWASLHDDGMLYIEVPSLDVVMKYFLDDFSLEHVSYFSHDSLLRLLGKCEVIKCDNSHFLRILVKKGISNHVYKKPNIVHIREFFNEFSVRLATFEQRILAQMESGVVVFYGVGLYFRTLFSRLLKLSSGGGELFVKSHVVFLMMVLLATRRRVLA